MSREIDEDQNLAPDKSDAWYVAAAYSAEQPVPVRIWVAGSFAHTLRYYSKVLKCASPVIEPLPPGTGRNRPKTFDCPKRATIRSLPRTQKHY